VPTTHKTKRWWMTTTSKPEGKPEGAKNRHKNNWKEQKNKEEGTQLHKEK
jgi:hypothetical protein